MNVAFLLDADNLSSASDVEQVFAHFRGIGIAVSVRRAYGGHDKLAGMKDVLRQHAVRSFINQGKGTTDAALVVDAMDLLHHDELPGTVAITQGSSAACSQTRQNSASTPCVKVRCRLRNQARPERPT